MNLQHLIGVKVFTRNIGMTEISWWHCMLWNRNASKISFWIVQCRSVVLFFRIAVQGARRTAIDMQNARSTTQALHSGVMNGLNGEFDEQNWDWNARKTTGNSQILLSFLGRNTFVLLFWGKAWMQINYIILGKNVWHQDLLVSVEPKGVEKGGIRSIHVEPSRKVQVRNRCVVQLLCCDLCDF